ncbi:MAG: 1-acyl-sn-glycerol-3-phosphate acyltransferase [Treponema sp.]|nr:1-acyl-sn-glycerol-3-phosphate acyltransferase [Treponema sp.]
MSIRRAAVNMVLKGLLNALCRIDNREFLEILSKNKPLIIAVNHINFLEVPILVTHSYPLYLTGLVKSETWDNPVFAFLFNTYSAIPIDREGSFNGAFRQVREAMDNGFFVAIAPEGTRSKNGVLGRGKAGIIHLALDAKAPVLPVVHYGGQDIWDNIRHLRRTSFCFRAGRPFRIRFDGRPDREVREEMLGEVMGQMARLLPEEMRGIYALQAERDCKYLEFLS